MDIRTELLREQSRANAERIALFVADDPERFAVLMRCVSHDTVLVGQRGAYSMSLVAEAHPQLITPYLKDLLEMLDKPVHEAVHRNTIRLMRQCELPKKLHGTIAGKMFDIIADPERSIAQRAFAITVAARLVKLYPDLQVEFRLLLEDALRTDPGPAVRSRASKVLKTLGGTMRPRGGRLAQ